LAQKIVRHHTRKGNVATSPFSSISPCILVPQASGVGCNAYGSMRSTFGKLCWTTRT
jgi:hypothetical protein